MKYLPDRLEVEHGVEGRDLQHADIGHPEPRRHGLDRRLRAASRLLLLRPPQQRDHRRGLPARRVLCDLLLRTSFVLGEKAKLLGCILGASDERP